jgi:hypothetical protein
VAAGARLLAYRRAATAAFVATLAEQVAVTRWDTR